jgi:hypothetical protein
MDYYNTLLDLVNNYAGTPLGSILSLDKQYCIYISHTIIFLTAAFTFTQLLTLFSGSPVRVDGTKKHINTANLGSSLIAGSGRSKKKKRQNLLVVCGPTNAGKTALFYHLLTKEVRTTVTSIDLNETSQLMEVKIPQEEATKKIHVVDIPGHYHFKDKLNETLEEAKAVIVVVDSKEK